MCIRDSWETSRTLNSLRKSRCTATTRRSPRTLTAGSSPVQASARRRAKMRAMTSEPWLHTIDDVVRAWRSDPTAGLTSDEVARRLAEHGPNELLAEPPVPMWRRVLAQMKDPLVVLLLVAVAVSLGAWIVEGATGWPFDSLVIGVIVVLNAVLGVVQERKAEDAVAALQMISAPTASVLRDGEQRRIPARDLSLIHI